MELVDKTPRAHEAERQWNAINEVLKKHGVLFGIPLGYGEYTVRGNTRDHFLAGLLDDNQQTPEENTEHDEWYEKHVRNAWVIDRKGLGVSIAVYLMNCPDGFVRARYVPFKPPHLRRLEILMETGGIRINTTLLSAERKAKQKLFEFLAEGQQHSYELEGGFVEPSPKSGLYYLVRKGRPTIALSDNNKKGIRGLCALCLHPLAYYDNTWAGALAPSDEALAHLLYIRGDEHEFWKRANHIPLEDPRSGI